jgi:transposase, IS5 family
LGDGVRVLIRTMKRIGKIAGTKLCDRNRSVKVRVLDIARAACSRAKQSHEKLNRSYSKLLNATSRVVGQAKQFSKEVVRGTKRARNVLQQPVL